MERPQERRTSEGCRGRRLQGDHHDRSESTLSAESSAAAACNLGFDDDRLAPHPAAYGLRGESDGRARSRRLSGALISAPCWPIVRGRVAPQAIQFPDLPNNAIQTRSKSRFHSEKVDPDRVQSRPSRQRRLQRKYGRCRTGCCMSFLVGIFRPGILSLLEPNAGLTV